MASTSKVDSAEDDGVQEEEVERFDDFTFASSWERFISEIEATCRQWLADGPKNLLEKGAVHLDSSENMYKVKSDLKYLMKSYCVEYYFEVEKNVRATNWDCAFHDLQLCFGVKDFLVIAPQSASGVVLDAPEASKLLSATAIALSNCASLWPAFVPVHDPSRDAYIGIQNMGTVFTRRFEADRICSQVPVKLMHLEGLYELFVSKFAYSTLDLSMHLFRVNFTMKLTYQTHPFDDDDIRGVDSESNETRDHAEGETTNRSQWDDDCPWSEWYSAEDPVKGINLIATWSEKIVESSLEMAELENSSPHEAERWTLLPNVSDCSKGSRVGFASQLRLLIDALDMSFGAQFLEDFISVENSSADNLRSSMVIPSPTVLDRVLKDLFQAEAKLPDFVNNVGHKRSRSIKGAPLESLFAKFCLHALWFGNCNIRAIAVLWIEFVREVRWCWEESQSLPKMPINGSIDLSTCLINQKLHMLAICIDKKLELNEDFEDCINTEDDDPAYIKDHSQGVEGSTDFPKTHKECNQKRDSPLAMDGLHGSQQAPPLRSDTKPEDKGPAYRKPLDGIRRGSAGIVDSVMLLKSEQSMHAPFTQDPPLMTEDMHEERLQAVEALGNSFDFSAQLEKDILLSDMSAFKAANPDAVFEDFIRWHSPRDWENDESEASSPSGTKGLKNHWPPRGRLSQRMSEHGNMWRKIWNDALALPVSEQKPLLDPNREGEKILHYLETLQPHQLLEQMVCTAFRASAETLNQSSFGALKQMNTKVDQLYTTMASTLAPLQAGKLSQGSENMEDLKRLCVVFEHIEKLLTLAASLHRKFLHAPRLSEAIFNDFYNFYLPKMGMGSDDADDQIEFNSTHDVRNREREVVSNLFKPPTANQSWRKVLSMGNLLNGHEPILREIIFSMTDHINGNHYAAHNAKVHEQDIETYRMYTCGTSNDLRVALSVISYD